MGSGDINMKKSWHPRLQKNQEEVWLREQAAIAERKKVDELRREREQERQMQELKQIYESAGGKKSTERMDWMYASPAVKSGPTDAELEDYLLGKKRVDTLLQQGESQKLSNTAEPGQISTQNANSAKDTATKLREDPLFAIKQHEKALRERLLKDPTRLRQLQARTRAERGESVHGEDEDYRRERHRRHREHRRKEREERHYREDRPHRHSHSSHRSDRHHRHHSHHRDSYRREASPRRECPQMDDATREARLAEMMSNAQEMQSARKEYIARVNDDELREANAESARREQARDNAGKAAFLLEHERNIYGQSGGMDLHERLRRGQRYERVHD